MNSVLGIVSAPTALGALDAARRTATTATKPFAELFRQSLAAASSAAAPEGSLAESEPSLREQLAEQLQELLASAGVAPGETVTLTVDDWTGDVSVGGHPLADAIEEALANEGGLAADLRQLGRLEGRFDGSPFKAAARLQVQPGAEGGLARLAWA